MAPGQDANDDNLGSLFDLLYNYGMLSVLIRMHNIQFHNKIRKVP